MRRGELGSSLHNNIGICVNALLDPPTRQEGMLWGFKKLYSKAEDLKHLWHPRFDNIRAVRAVSFRYNLYVFTDHPRKYQQLLTESLFPLGFVGMVFYKTMPGLRQEVERYNLLRFLASSEEQVSVVGEKARLFDLSYQQEKELFKQ